MPHRGGGARELASEKGAEPYRIEAVGDIGMMRASLADSQSVQIYNEYVDAYDLGLSIEDSTDLDIPAYDVTPQLEWAKPLTSN